MGGVLELYTSRRTFIRFDAGDTVVLRDERLVAVGVNPSQGLSIAPRRLAFVPGDTTHNFQGSVGVGFRF